MHIRGTSLRPSQQNVGERGSGGRGVEGGQWGRGAHYSVTPNANASQREVGRN